MTTHVSTLGSSVTVRRMTPFRHRVGKVRQSSSWAWAQTREFDRQRVADVRLGVGDGRRSSRSPLPARSTSTTWTTRLAARDARRERQPTSDLQHTSRSSSSASRSMTSRSCGRREVLTERARTCPARAHQPEDGCGGRLDGDIDSSSATVARRRSPGRSRQRSPACSACRRIGTGARYGASVSTSSRPSGTRMAASISDVAFG